MSRELRERERMERERVDRERLERERERHFSNSSYNSSKYNPTCFRLNLAYGTTSLWIRMSWPSYVCNRITHVSFEFPKSLTNLGVTDDTFGQFFFVFFKRFLGKKILRFTPPPPPQEIGDRSLHQ